ncbi:uncharacterized protein [Cicer arietinum]|uniref:Serine/threonine-protein kinase pakG-like n=1 Tax=Cicer arietinum TaxID=3827 RepID=A0A3Q7WXV7_CICAR|nr:serine/threonine-protein kinase pakG-like [Cicer arietinum]XP_027186519.1 serine/threonine-protein kinase pakG-like [Cicer arietinum]XP_027186520.1 serine/threonine-protein kinase pakG-like [Cicer arietinum]XP_027186521.1 serine/threonine-protein kinase pakG-like [Cicer arietinum]
MARTKTSVRKNAFTYSSSSSSPTSDSEIHHSPSPPPRQSQPHISSYTTFSNYLSSSPKKNQNPLNPNPLSIVLPPLYPSPFPNLAQVPPHLRNPTPAKCRSMHILFGIGTSKTSNFKSPYFIISDSETDESSNTPPHTTPKEKTTTPTKSTKPITPSKPSFSSEPSQSTTPNQKMRLINEISVLPRTISVFLSKSKKPPPRSTKIKNTMTIAQFLARNNLRNPKRMKTHTPKQNFKNTEPTYLEHSPIPQCSPTLTPEFFPCRECSPDRMPSPSQNQECSPIQERSPTKPPPPSDPQEHSLFRDYPSSYTFSLTEIQMFSHSRTLIILHI